MKQFITHKKIKVLRYKLYYFIFALVVFMIFFLNLFVSFFLNHVSYDGFKNVLVRNSFGSSTASFLDTNALYYNSFGFPYDSSEMVIDTNYSLKDIYVKDYDQVVYLYNTFQTDQYKSNFFHSYSIASYVTQASFILSEYLEDENIGSVVEEASVVKVAKEHDIPYTNSYAASRILLEENSNETKSLKYFFDLQVSDYDRDATTVVIDNVEYAKILFVVGTDYGSYQDNLAFAQKLNALLEKASPTLSRGVSLRGGSGYQGVYNQDFSPYTLLIQVGGVHNTIDEVTRSLKILAEVIATYIKEEQNEEE